MNKINDIEKNVELDMRRWLERAVIGLNLCPFAKAVHVKEQIHYAVSQAQTPQDLLQDLEDEIVALMAHEPEERSTTLLMAPHCLDDFLDFNDFLEIADHVLTELELDSVLQIASFHPQFQFADTEPNDVTNNTNRAPYPTLHLLREDSIDMAVAAFPEADSIFEVNMKTLEKLGHAGWAALDVGRTTPRQDPPVPSPDDPTGGNSGTQK